MTMYFPSAPDDDGCCECEVTDGDEETMHWIDADNRITVIDDDGRDIPCALAKATADAIIAAVEDSRNRAACDGDGDGDGDDHDAKLDAYRDR